MNRSLFLVSLLTLFGLGCNSTTGTESIRARNVILFLGDGTSLDTINAASAHRYGKPQALYVQNMPHIGLMETSTASDWVSDSAAGMTAIVTGVKTHNGVISQGPGAVRGEKDGQALKTILEYAEEHGLATGVVTNSPVADATPAACYAHGNERERWARHLLQILEPRFGDGVDVAIGLGEEKLADRAAELGVDLKSKFEKAGYRYLDDLAKWNGEDAAEARLIGVVEAESRFDFPLTEAVDLALDILTARPTGFFLMVESDNHLGDARKSVEQMAKCDDIIRRTAERMRGTDTLILFASDHSYDLHFPQGGPLGEDIIPGLIVEGHHNAEEVLVAAEGPGAERVKGFFPNTHLFEIMLAAYGWER